MLKKFHGHISDNTLTLEGNLDEFAEFEVVRNLVLGFLIEHKADFLKVDFSKIFRMNSCGLSLWLKLLKDAKTKMIYINAPWWLIDQMSMHTNILSHNSLVLSFFAPFTQENQLDTSYILLVVGETFPVLESYENFEIAPIYRNGEKYLADFFADDFLFFISEEYEKYCEATQAQKIAS